MFYKVETAVRIGLTKATPTDLPYNWNQNFTKNIDGETVATINTYTDKAEAKLNLKPSSTSQISSSQAQHFDQFLKDVNMVVPKTVALSLFNSHQEQFVHVPVPDPCAETLQLPSS